MRRLGVDVQVVDVGGGSRPVDLVDHVLRVERLDVIQAAVTDS
jgi:hypothetical protein